MRKLLSAFLALALVSTFAAPALALDPAQDLDPPLWERWGYESYEDMLTYWTEGEYAETVADQRDWEARKDAYRAAHADELAAFDAEAYFLAEYPWYSSKEEYMEMYGLADQAAFEANLLDAYVIDRVAVEDYKAEWAALQAEEPERTALFLTELDGWFAANYYDYDDIEQYIEENSWLTCLEEAYLEFFEEWNGAYAFEQEQVLARAGFITAHGGAPGELGILLNDAYLTFPTDRAPYAKNGTAYADAETLSAALGIDVPAPIDGYAAVRSAAEKAGLHVYWDGMYNTVVLLDTTALAGRIDESFTILNGLLAQWAEPQAGTTKETDKLKGSLTLFDSLDGDKVLPFTLDAVTLHSAQGFQVTGKYDLSAAANLLKELADQGEEDIDTYLGELNDLLALVKGDFELRADYERGALYLKSALVDWLYTLSSYQEEELSPDTWYAASGLYDLSGHGTHQPSEKTTVGGLFCTSAEQSALWMSPALLYDEIQSSAEQAAQVFGDGAFTKSGQNWTLTFGLEDCAALLDTDVDDGYYSLPEKLELSLTIKSDGTVTGAFAYQSRDYDYGSEITRVTADFTLSPKSQKLTLEIHTKNAYQLILELSGSTAATTQEPATTPPPGANIVEY